ncbi:hypothetical protein AeRB84_017522 [Aphanomyces euteiches]|nr:hypothetical protein AeRB84_017522 [Aphanomyces euteiches]
MALDGYEERLRASVRLLASKLASAATPPVISEESDTNSLSAPTPVIWNISSPSPTIAPQVFFANEDSATMPQQLSLLAGERLGFWRTSEVDHEAHCQAFLDAKILNEPAVVLADTGANMSVLHTRFAERLGLRVDASTKTGIDGFGYGSATTADTVPIKLTIGDGLTYLFTIAVCDFGPVGFHAILGMDFLEKAGMIIDTVKREIQLPDDNWIPLVLQPIKYRRGRVDTVKTPRQIQLQPGDSVCIKLPSPRPGLTNAPEFWVQRGARWVTTAIVDDSGTPRSYRVTNVGNSLLVLPPHSVVGAISAPGDRPNDHTMVRTNSLRYKEWKAAAYEGSYSRRYQRMRDQVMAGDCPEMPYTDRHRELPQKHS